MSLRQNDIFFYVANVDVINLEVTNIQRKRYLKFYIADEPIFKAYRNIPCISVAT